MEQDKVLATQHRISQVGEVLSENEVPMKHLQDLQDSSDPYDQIVLKSLQISVDDECPLYIHQYRALYALAEGKDVILVSPCGSGKSRVLVNGLYASALGMKHRGHAISGEPLCIVNTPLNSIMEEKIAIDPAAGMLSMSGKANVGSQDDQTISFDKPEEYFFDGTVKRIYGHPRSFTSKLGQQILEANQDRIVLHACDELAQYLWGSDFRKIELQVVPGSNRIFAAENSPFLAMTATLRKPYEVLETKRLLGMEDRDCEVIDCNPVKLNPFYCTLLRPSNKTSFYASNGLCSMLRALYLDKFVINPMSQPTCIVFGRQEVVLGETSSFLVSRMEDAYPNNRTRPFVQYHGATDELTLSHIHKRIKNPGATPIKLFLATDKLIMGVDIQDIELVIYIRPPNTLHGWEQGSGRARGGKGAELGSKKTVTVLLYNEEDLKSNVDGLTDSMREFCRSTTCLKQQSSKFFGYDIQSNLNSWCCSNCTKE